MSGRRATLAYPLLLALYPAISLFSANLGQHPLRSLVVPLGVSVLLAAAAFLLARLSTHEAALVAFRAFGLLFLFFAAGQIRARLPGDTEIAGGLWFRPRHVVDLAWTVAGVLVLRFRPRRLDTVGRALGLFSLALLALAAGPVAWSTLSGAAPRPRPSAAAAAAPEHAPHVFYVVLDGYARADVLRETFGFDNAPFLAALEQRGFYVAGGAYANYSQTALSLASSLNMEHVDALVPVPPKYAHDRAPLTRALRQNRVMDAFRSRGYTTVAFSTGYAAAEVRSADRFHEAGAPPAGYEFLRGFLDLTPVPPLRAGVLAAERTIRSAGHGGAPARTWTETHRAHVLETLDALPALAAERDPLFVFAHVLAPHPPFVFDRTGALPGHVALEKEVFTVDGDMWRDRTGLDAATYRRRYGEQISYLNDRVLRLIDDVLKQASRPVVILLQGDHGPGSGLTWEDPGKTDLRERLGVLSAYRFPDGSARLYPTITPVNSFRVVLSRLFGFDLPLLPDLSFYSTLTRPYKLLPLRAGTDGSLRLEADLAAGGR